jgi:dihydrofolate synthase/folylpolyglutamate synthase
MPGRFVSSGDVFRWIEGFINYERGGRLGLREFRLRRMEILAARAGHPERTAPVIHVAGSKGKGSVTGMAGAILEAGGIKTARYASPHVSDYRERIGGGRGFFSEALYSAAGEELAAVEEALGRLPPEDREEFAGGAGEGGPTFFELCTLYFFLCARRAGAEALAVETGLGGRLDATNIVDPRVSVITLIEREHTAYLGDTLGAIAGEKGGIVKPLRPLVLAPQEEEALKVLRERAAAQGSPLHYFPEAAELGDIRIGPWGTAFTLRLLPGEGRGEGLFLRDLVVPLPGEVQAANAGLAVLAAVLAFPALTEGAIRAGLAAFRLPARFERLREDPAYVVDGAHTPVSAAACAATFTALYGGGGILLFGCAEDKDAAAMARILSPHFSLIIITAPGSFKKSDPRKVFGDFGRALGACPGPELLLAAETGEAVRLSLERSREGRLPVLGMGSFYLAGEIRNFLAGE